MMSKYPLFAVGQVVMTVGVNKAVQKNALSHAQLLTFLNRHRHGDFGPLDDEDNVSNMAAIENGDRILSSYPLNEKEKVWIITEADRSVTTILFPDEY